jgi:RTX calcium-binding nonapeptide repeat (4 copies)
MRLAWIAALGLALMPIAAPSALAAGTVSYSVGMGFGVVSYNGDGGVNVVTFSDEPLGVSDTRVRIAETGISEDPAVPECVDEGNSVRCDVPTFTIVSASFVGGTDVGTVNATRLAHSLNGGADGDQLTGADATPISGSESLSGGIGDDTVVARGGVDNVEGNEGVDSVDGGAGDDNFDQGPGDGPGDTLRGGDGFDEIDIFGAAPGWFVSLADAVVRRADGSEAASLESFEDIDGSPQDDTLIGSDGADDIEGEDGNDQIDGRLGGDILEGEDNDDTIQARDGVNDRVIGGRDTDTCILDQFDQHSECESAQVLTVPPFGFVTPDNAGPRCTASGLRTRVRRRTLLRSGLGFTARCNERGRVAASLIGRIRRVRGRTRVSANGDITLGSTSRRLGAGNRIRLRLRVSRSLRRLIGRRATLRVVLRATDALGNERTTSRRVRVR